MWYLLFQGYGVCTVYNWNVELLYIAEEKLVAHEVVAANLRCGAADDVVDSVLGWRRQGTAARSN